ncbi:MAG: PDZ domain-containing protein [Acidobacteria bacterium]|nr:PDZ domain-containing protein [Acidobacteriota bacterium]
MINRKFIYIFIAAFSAAAVLLVVWKFIARDIPGFSREGTLQETGETEQAVSGTDAAAGGKSSADPDRAEPQDGYPLVMKLMESFRKRQVFGSFRVVSVIVHDTAPGSSRATIEDTGTGASLTYSIDDTLPDGSRLADIRQDCIILEKDGVRKRIDFNSAGADSGKGRSGAWRGGYKKIKDNEFDLNPYRAFRGDAAGVLDFTMEVHSRDGAMVGIQVSDIEKNALLRNLGLQEGDVLVGVNGKPVDSLLNGVKACLNAYYSDDVQLKVRRGDEIVTLDYNLFWEGRGSWTPMEVLRSRAVSSLFEGGIAPHLF